MARPHGGSIIGERLARRGVSHLFALCGGHISPILTGAQDHGVEIVDVRDEVSAVFAADAVARMTGIPGVAAVTAGPGVTNTVTAVKNAQMAESPVVILGGAAATVLKGRGALQDIDQMSLMEPLTKWCTRVTKLSALAPTIDRALEVAADGVPGPVFVEVPIDLLYPEEMVREWYIAESGVDKMSGPVAIALELYLKGHLARQFKAPHIDVDLGLDFSAIQKALPIGSSSHGKADEAARALAGAKRPVLIVGSQALVNMTPGQAREIAQAVEALGVPTFLGGMARGLLGRFSDVQFRHKRTAALRKCDVCIVAGFPFDFRLGYGQKINGKATLISANLDPVALKKNRRPDIAAQTHPGRFLMDLALRAHGPKSSWESWFEEVRQREEARDAEIGEMAEVRGDDDGVNPLYFFMRREEKLADDSVLVVDGGDFVATGAYTLRPRGPLSWLDPGVFGTLGVGGGFTLGAQLVRPDAEVWLVWGDGSSAYSLAEFDTYVRHGLAPIAVVGTDASWAQIAREQVEILGTSLACDLRRTDYHEVAKGYGGEGILVTDPADVDDALDRAKALSAEGKPVLINLHLAKSDFRKGSISM